MESGHHKKGSRIGQSLPGFCVEIHPQDAAKAGLQEGEPVKCFAEGAIETICKISDAVSPACLRGDFLFPCIVNDLLMTTPDPPATTLNIKYLLESGEEIEERQDATLICPH